ncbi:chromate resistance protein ChrB [Caloramator sp. E03]|uniref:Chromate resistance protein ChrB n=1 Tax=Caloramator sp. E03 TaxID=2576307 RepID=UPI001110E082|nr:Chromate resistance protein ChrB [Caloramator sp. E03]QCX33000.1 chromate resistance protein ChrB [Caloramator sp. E03]
MEYNFYFISYNLPSEPSRIRVSMWRKLKKIGALNIHQSLWVIPEFPNILEELEKIKDFTEKEEGNIFIVYGKFMEGVDEIIKKFNEERDKEYGELIEYCEKFHEEMIRETQIKNFTFAELEENEEEINKLIDWFEKIKRRDYFKSELSENAQNEINRCKAEFEDFSDKVYRAYN